MPFVVDGDAVCVCIFFRISLYGNLMLFNGRGQNIVDIEFTYDAEELISNE